MLEKLSFKLNVTTTEIESVCEYPASPDTPNDPEQALQALFAEAALLAKFNKKEEEYRKALDLNELVDFNFYCKETRNFGGYDFVVIKKDSFETLQALATAVIFKDRLLVSLRKDDTVFKTVITEQGHQSTTLEYYREGMICSFPGGYPSLFYKMDLFYMVLPDLPDRLICDEVIYRKEKDLCIWK